MNSKLTLLSVFALLFLSNSLQSQDVPDWAWKTPLSRVYPTGEAHNLPSAQNQINYVNPNKTTRVVHTQNGDFVLPPNIRPFPDAATQSEVDACNMGGNVSTLYFQWNSYGPSFWGTGFAFSNNAGVSWIGNKQTAGNNGGDPGVWVWPATSTWAGRLGISYLNGAYTQTLASYSTDNGTTWTAGALLGGSTPDKNLSCVDDVVGSPFFGRAYTVWTDFGGANTNRIVGAYSNDGGATWIGYQPVAPAVLASHHDQGCDVEVGPGGVVYCIWATCLTNGQNSTEDYLGFAKSTNGGVTWIAQNNQAVDVNGIRSASYLNGIRSNGFPRLAVDKSGGARNGWIYAVMSEKTVAPATDNGDVCMCRSTDGGTTWTHTRVNQDAPANGKLQYECAVTVDNTGAVYVTYYDQRNTSATQAEYWMSTSQNGGATWSDVAASDHAFTPGAIPGLAGGYQGDYTGVTWSTGKVWPVWADNSSGIYQVWTVGISTGPAPAHDYATGPFMNFPASPLLINTNYNIKTQITNAGTSNETSVPITFYINGVLTNTTNKSLNASQIDSVNNVWMPTTAGSYTLKYISNLATDLNRANDTVQTTVNVLSSLPALCEEFTPATFPPTGWTYSGSWWSRQAVSGFGVGSGSARYNMWSAPAGANEDLITLTFPPVNSTTVINVDMAFAPYPATAPYAQDSLIILASTNGGTTYTSIARLGPLQMQTTPALSSQFTPTASQWVKRNYPLPTGTNKIDFLGKSQFGNDLFIDSICLGPLVGISHNGESVPGVYSLSQNYPNPFNPTTSINFGLPKAGQVKLVVYDILGRVVATLVNEHREAGMYNEIFDASQISSGVYFYKLESGDYTSIKKMVLIK